MSTLLSKYKIIKEGNLVIQCHSGILDLNSYTSFAQKLILDPLFSPNLDHLVCVRKVAFRATMSDVIKYIKFSKENFKTPKKRYISIITNTPNQVVLSTLFKILRQDPVQSIEIFSTEKKAIEWLDIKGLSAKEITAILKKLN